MNSELNYLSSTVYPSQCQVLLTKTISYINETDCKTASSIVKSSKIHPIYIHVDVVAG